MESQIKNAVDCAGCAFMADCGGIQDKSLFDWGCYSGCLLGCNSLNCDLTCPNNPALFAKRFAEIGGTFRLSSPLLKAPRLQLPQYVPKIHNGSGRISPLSLSVVALPARALLRKIGSTVVCRFKSSKEVRQHFRLSENTSYLITCISVDEDVEIFWAGLRYGQLAVEIARLRPAAIIVPNFSFFTDVPRIHTLYNRKRIFLAAEMLSEAGCNVIMPLNALTPNDWNYWLELLRQNPKMCYVTKEFQTGLAGHKTSTAAIMQLAKLQDQLKRNLHPVILGGGWQKSNLNMYFQKHTIIESRAFLLTVKRHLAQQDKSGTYSEVVSPTQLGAPLDDLLRRNIKARSKMLQCR